jgi:hypothetical protein
MNKFISVSCCLILCFAFTIVNGQNANSGALIGQDSNKHKVMIIPFDQYNYFSDADPELAEKNEKPVTDISRLFRYGLNYNISARVISTNETYNILTDTTVQSGTDLKMIYASITYRFEHPMNVVKGDSVGKAVAQPDLFGNGVVEEEKKEKSNPFKKKSEDEAEKTAKYLNAVITHPEIFTGLQQKYGTDLFLFINQFELVTNYNHCLDRSANYFERKVVVHYSIYDANAKQLQGGAHTVTFSSGETNVDKIIATQFPLVADYLSTAIADVSKPVLK